MAKWIAIWRQGGGCDYTIGCGVAVHHFEADGKDAAIEFVKQQLSDPELSDEINIEQVDLVEYVNGFTTLLPGVWEDERHRRVEGLKSSEEERKERAEYERLSKKFSRR